jgi:transposase
MTKRFWAGLDVGVETTAVCVIDDAGEIVHEGSCPTAVKSVHRELVCLRRRRFATVGLEAATGTTLARGLRNLGYKVELYEQRQLSKFLRLRRNKTDAGDAIGIAEAGRLGATTVSRIHLKSLECQCLQSRLTIRRHLIRQRIAAVNILGRQLEHFGGRLPRKDLTRLRYNVEAEIRKIFGRTPNDLVRALRHLVHHCEQLIDYQRTVDDELRRSAFDNEVCRRFMEIPGVGPLCALTFYAVVSDPGRFSRSADVGSYLGLTPRIDQSGLTLRRGRISKMGNSAAAHLVGGLERHVPAVGRPGYWPPGLGRGDRSAPRRKKGKDRARPQAFDRDALDVEERAKLCAPAAPGRVGMNHANRGSAGPDLDGSSVVLDGRYIMGDRPGQAAARRSGYSSGLMERSPLAVRPEPALGSTAPWV